MPWLTPRPPLPRVRSGAEGALDRADAATRLLLSEDFGAALNARLQRAQLPQQVREHRLGEPGADVCVSMVARSVEASTAQTFEFASRIPDAVKASMAATSIPSRPSARPRQSRSPRRPGESPGWGAREPRSARTVATEAPNGGVQTLFASPPVEDQCLRFPQVADIAAREENAVKGAATPPSSSGNRAETMNYFIMVLGDTSWAPTASPVVPGWKWC